MKVLIVEDDDFARDASARYLDHLGHEVAAVATAAEAAARADDQPPDVVICDWRLAHGDDGADVARALQQRYSTPIIFITAHPLGRLRSQTRDLNVARYLRKPISLVSLASVLDEINATPSI
jgi:CheY-like chemotaxis protein